MDEEVPNKLHPLVSKQLKRSGIDTTENVSPSWQAFLNRVSRAYYDNEQDRYLLERSMEISSREMRELNDKLETAQEIAHLGYWFYNPTENKFLWSQETYRIMGIDPQQGTPTLKQLFDNVTLEDCAHVKSVLRSAIEAGKDYAIEFRFNRPMDGKTIWIHTKGHPYALQGHEQPVISGIVMDITERKTNEENMKNLHQQLLSISRQAGMAEVATSVLHNIGNILNSAGVSIGLLSEQLMQSRLQKLTALSKIIKEHLMKDDRYLMDDPNGKLIPDYLIALVTHFANTHEMIDSEIKNIATHLEHIKEIVSLQKDLSGISGVKEPILPEDIIDTALQMSASANHTNIQIIKEIKCNTPLLAEKAKLLQILVNLVRNAKESILEMPENNPKTILISVSQCDNSKFACLSITDSGKGILKENLTRIFSMGYTNKKNGHGFGLHSSAIAAKELGGSLKVKSNGENQGATFIIEVPLATTLEPKKEAEQTYV